MLLYFTKVMSLEKVNSAFVLASSSPRRRDMLERMGLVFDIFPAVVDETPLPGGEPAEEAVRIAREKAAWSAGRVEPGRWVLAADTIVVVDGEVLLKPRDAEDAARMLRKISGRRHRVITGWCLIKAPDEVAYSRYSESEVNIRPLDEATIRGYVNTGEPMDKAGSYAVQGIGAFMVREINGSYTNVVGLPLCEVIEALEEVGAARLFGDD